MLLPPQLCVLHSLKKGAVMISRYVPHLLWWLQTLLLASELRDKLSPKDR